MSRRVIAGVVLLVVVVWFAVAQSDPFQPPSAEIPNQTETDKLRSELQQAKGEIQELRNRIFDAELRLGKLEHPDTPDPAYLSGGEKSMSQI